MAFTVERVSPADAVTITADFADVTSDGILLLMRDGPDQRIVVAAFPTGHWTALYDAAHAPAAELKAW